MTNNGSNQNYKNNSDGWELTGGVTPRKITLSGGDIAMVGSGSAVITFPTVTSTLFSSATGSISSATLLGSMTDETGTGVLVFNTSPTLITPVLGVANATKIKIGTSSPTALLHIEAGTATAGTAPIKLTTGTPLTTPEDGAIEYHSSHLYFTIGSTRQRLDLSNDAFGIGVGSTSGLTTGSKGYKMIPWDCTIVGWIITADVTGDVVFDIKKSSYAGFPTMSSIAGSEKPTLSSAQKNQDLSLTTWTTSLSAGDIIEFVIDSVATIAKCQVSILVNKN